MAAFSMRNLFNSPAAVTYFSYRLSNRSFRIVDAWHFAVRGHRDRSV